MYVQLAYCGKGVHQQQALVRKRKQCVHFEFGVLVPYYMGDGGGGGGGLECRQCPVPRLPDDVCLFPLPITVMSLD